MSGRTPGLTSGESQAFLFNRLTLQPQLANLLAHFVASIDNSFICLTFVINYFSLVESITENIFDGTSREKVTLSRSITQTVQMVGNFTL